VVRCESALLYFNVEYVRDRLFELLAARRDAVRLVVFYLGVVPKIDLAGAELLADLHRTFLTRGVAFRVADVHGDVRSALRRIGFDREYGTLETGQTVHLVVSAWQASAAPAAFSPH
jgi:SulP family sulfate permease